MAYDLELGRLAGAWTEKFITSMNLMSRGEITTNFHEFVFDLQTDTAGNFYFIKAGPVKNGGRGFQQILDHHGCLMKVTADEKS